MGGYLHSLNVDAAHRGLGDDRTQFDRYHALYRGSEAFGSTQMHVDADVSILPQDPAGNLLLRDGTDVHTDFPVHANYNPSGAKLNQQRYQLAVGFDGDSALGRWTTKVAVTRTLNDVLRGFLRGDAFANPPDAGVGEGDTLAISAPRNHFPLAHDAKRSLLLAGGIGVTPILCMAERLAITGAGFELHYCTRSRERTATFALSPG